MALLRKSYMGFDEEDVNQLKAMLSKFHALHKNTGMPDYSNNYVGYLPVFIISMLAAQEGMDKLTKRLLRLTWVLIFLTVVVCILTGVLLYRGA